MKLNLVSEKVGRITSLEELFEASDINPKHREVLKHKVNKREVAMNKKDWTTELTELFQIFAEVKPIHDLLQPDIRGILLEAFEGSIPRLQGPPLKDWPLLANINLADIHIWRVEERNPDKYEKQIFDRTMDTFNALLGSNPDKLLFTSLWDMANSEFNWLTSSGKNRQDNGMDSREMFQRVLNLHTDLIRNFATEIPTEVIIIPWNHDRSLMANVWTALDIWFSNANNVDIDNTDSPRKYRKWWITNLAFSHWDWEKPRQRLWVMSQEFGLNKENARIIWHFHEKEVKQYGPLEVETLGSPAVQSVREKNQFAHKAAKIWGKLYDKKKGKVKEVFK